MKRFSALTFFLFALTWANVFASEDSTVLVSSWGGSYEQAQLSAYTKPFEEETGIKVILIPYGGGIDELRPDENGEVDFDVVDLTESDAKLACNEGLLANFDEFMVAPSPEEVSPIHDFVQGSIFDCGVAHIEYATVIGFDDRAFTDEKPSSVADIFDIERFPGKRALRREPKAILEWALISYGVPVQQVYDLLSTERGFRLVTRRMNQIRDHIVWWEMGQEPIELLKNGEVVIAAGFNGRFFDARINQNIPLSIIQEGQLLEFGFWGISKHSKNLDNAKKFIRYVTSTRSMAAFSNRLPYNPTRSSAWSRIGLHVTKNVAMIKHMPTEAAGYKNGIRIDGEWYLQTERIRQDWFDLWLEGSN